MTKKTISRWIVASLAAIISATPALSFSKDRAKIQGSVSVQGKSKKDYSALAKISLQEAITLASKAAPGKVIEISLDDEDGFLVYEAEIMGSDQVKKEVLLDAGNGKTLLVKNDKKHDEDEEEEDND